MRDCGSYSTTTRTSRPSSTSRCSSVLPGQSPPTAFKCVPGATMSGVRITALRLSAVTVVITSAPRVASAAEAQISSSRSCNSGWLRRLATSLALAAGSTSNRRRLRMPSSWWKAIAWNSLCAPLPIRAITRLSGRAIQRAARADMAAVRRAVVSVSSESSSG